MSVYVEIDVHRKAIASARLKNDKAGAAILAQLLRAGLLPEARVAPRAAGAARAGRGSPPRSCRLSPTRSPATPLALTGARQQPTAASGEQVTGSNQHGLLTAGTPMGSAAPGRIARRPRQVASGELLRYGRW
jgi:hypothetical protein